ncbi:hypothetical protein [[Kitasatospora] papulosa]
MDQRRAGRDPEVQQLRALIKHEETGADRELRDEFATPEGPVAWMC